MARKREGCAADFLRSAAPAKEGRTGWTSKQGKAGAVSGRTK